jgi:cell division inhibitor SepF
MGSLRKAGVWLGLVEDDEARAYERNYGRVHDRDDRRSDSYADDYAVEDDLELEDDLDEPAPAVPLRRSAPRSVGRPAGAGAPMLTHDNLALAPQAALRERSAVFDEAARDGVADDDSEYRITTLHPTTYNEARVIGEHFRSATPVIMNLTEMDESDAKRLVDFAAGLAFGLRGSIERVTNRVFLLSPANVTVTAEAKARIAEGGFFNQS